MKKILLLFSFFAGLAAHLHAQDLKPKEIKGKWGFVNATGKVVIAPKYDLAINFYEGLAAVQLNGKWGYIDKTGKVIVPVKYEYTGFFSEDLMTVRLNNKWGYVDKRGKEVIPPKYDFAAPFKDGKAGVALDGKEMVIDKDGTVIKQTNPLLASLSEEDRLEAEKNLRSDIVTYTEGGKLGLKKTDGTVLTYAHFSKITFQRSPSESIDKYTFLYRLTGFLKDNNGQSYFADVWYKPYQDEINPANITGYRFNGGDCRACKGTGEITTKEKEQVWVKASREATGTSSSTQTHADIYSDKRGSTVTTTRTSTSYKNIPGHYEDGKTITKTEKCYKCTKGKLIKVHKTYYDSRINRYDNKEVEE